MFYAADYENGRAYEFLSEKLRDFYVRNRHCEALSTQAWFYEYKSNKPKHEVFDGHIKGMRWHENFKSYQLQWDKV